jgi:zinc D-Ala-D-Ala dipeptidase
LRTLATITAIIIAFLCKAWSVSRLLLFMSLCFFVANTAWAAGVKSARPKGFVYIERVVPNIQTDIRYFTTNNFVGQRVDGYLAPRCILTIKAAQALQKVQADLEPFGLGLKLFDCYRPQRAVDHFIRWASDLADTKTKDRFYPEVDKKNLFKEGYIATPSSHSRGSTIDLTIIVLTGYGSGQEIDMGTSFDLFSLNSSPMSGEIAGNQRANRMLLRTLMIKRGFLPYEPEWWHFTLKNEPYPTTYFDFPIQ